MSSTPPPFKGFAFAGDVFDTDEELQAKVRSFEFAPFVYSAVADGNWGPIPISPAEFSVAIERGWEDFSDPHAKRPPFQLMIRDRDTRRGGRRSIPVPHWIYVQHDRPFEGTVAAAALPLPSGFRTTKEASAEEKCGDWLASLPAFPRMKKEDALETAHAQFAGLSDKAFDRQWADKAPKAWTRPGAFKKSPQR